MSALPRVVGEGWLPRGTWAVSVIQMARTDSRWFFFYE